MRRKNLYAIALLTFVSLGASEAWAKRIIYGTIKDVGGTPMAGIVVRAWDEDTNADDELMGSATTNSSGQYRIGPYTGKHWDAALPGSTAWRPDIYVKAYAVIQGRSVPVKQSKTYDNWRQARDLRIDLTLTGISGQITNAAGAPQGGLRVRAWDEDDVLGGKHDFMNETTTDSQGRYFMMYEGKHWDPAPHGMTTWRPDIFLKVLRNVPGYGWVKVKESRKYEDWKHRKHLTINLPVPKTDWVERSTAFDPAVHSWPFENDRFKICASPFTCKLEHPPLPPLIFRWALCGGMSLTALKRFHTHRSVEPFSPSVKEELVRAQLETLISADAWEKFLRWTAKPDHSDTIALHTIGKDTKEQWPLLRSAIDKRAPIVLGLIYVGPSNIPNEVAENHQVLGIGYRYNDGTKEVEIGAYDPNYPGVVSTIRMNIGIPENQISASQKTVYHGQTKTKHVRGFFVIPVGSGPPQ